jgi:hypothetical protein
MVNPQITRGYGLIKIRAFDSLNKINIALEKDYTRDVGLISPKLFFGEGG